MSSKLTVLLENTKPEQSPFEVEHGLSLHIQTSQSNFIFDCGHTGLAWSNAEKLNVDLSKVQFTVISHSHYDHAAGFPKLLQYVKPKKLYTGINFWREKFSYDADNQEYKYKGCGFTEENLKSWGIEQSICSDIFKLDDEAWLIGNFVKQYVFETIPLKFVCGVDKKQDDFSDEIVLVLREGDGVAVVTGCAHNGILNIAATVRKKLNLPIYSVIGGIHLKGANEMRIDKTLNKLKAIGVKKFALCHCSGDEVFNRISSDCRISTGNVINF